MKKILLLSSLLFLACKSAPAVENTPYKVSFESVSRTLKHLSSDELEGRDTGSAGIAKAATYIEGVFKKSGVQPYFKTYRDTLTNYPETAYNIVGYIEGNDPELKKEFIVLGAHYDHIGIAATAVDGDVINNGANDDASGTTAVLEMAKYFGTHKTNKRSVLFVLFSAEEKGLLGSEHLAAKLKKQNFNLYLMFNYEMIGVPMKRDFTAYLTGYQKSNMADELNGYAGKKLVGFLPAELTYQLFKASDNYPFYENFKVPAQTICTFDFENFEYYHHVKDEYEQMDVVHMTSFIQEMVPVMEQMINSKTRTIHLN